MSLDVTAATTRPGGAEPLVRVRDLSVSFAGRQVVHGVSFDLTAGSCVAVVGESGSGKSVSARSLLGLAGTGARVSASELSFAGRDLRGLDDRGWRSVRGRDIGLVLQDALVSLDPLRRVGDEVAEPLRLHRRGGRSARREQAVRLLADVGVPQPELRARQRPSELSGGLRQRALIAAGLALDPPVLIADEPTTALDATVQAQVLDLLAESVARGRSVLLISHDLAVVDRLADTVLVVRDGRIVESGPTAQVLGNPEHEYTRGLIAAVPSARSRGARLSSSGTTAVPRPRTSVVPPVPDEAEPLLRVSSVSKHYRGPDGVVRTVVDGVSFDVRRGETVGIVGESGSGKSTTAAIALALTAPDAGSVDFEGAPWTAVTEKQRRPRRRRLGYVHQDPLSSFDPRYDVRRVLNDAIGRADGEDPVARSLELLEQVGLPARHLDDHPLRLSGGQRQRVAIARALATRPDLVVCDEPVSALDVSIQAQVLDLLGDLQDELGTAYLFISHDLGVVHHLSDRVLVMKDGRVVESGGADEVFERPQHAYTQALLAAVPRLRSSAGTPGAPA